MIKHVITLNESHIFSDLSGDYNPIHIDPIFARRGPFGTSLVHGIHILMLGLDEWASHMKVDFQFTALKAKFSDIVPTNAEVSYSFEEKKNAILLNVMCNGKKVQKCRFSYELASDKSSPVISDHKFKLEPAEAKSFEQLLEVSGKTELCLQGQNTQTLFPHLHKYANLQLLAILTASTKIVGMKCPGLNSIYTGLDLKFTPTEEDRFLSYKVSLSDDRFKVLNISIENNNVSGVLNTLYRPAPKQQASFRNIKKLVAEPKFTRRTAFIVGGSRGIGEVLAKLYAAHGGQVILTYHHGAEEAEQICQEIGSDKCFAFAYDVAQPPKERPHSLCENMSDIDIFLTASPKILNGLPNERYDLYKSYYVDALETVLATTQSWWQEGLNIRVFNPSTTYIDENPDGFSDYVRAKEEGEQMLSKIMVTSENVTGKSYRLPRMKTDQNLEFGVESDEILAPEIILAPLLEDFAEV